MPTGVPAVMARAFSTYRFAGKNRDCSLMGDFFTVKSPVWEVKPTLIFPLGTSAMPARSKNAVLVS